MSTAVEFLPEIIEEIVYRLPVKSVVRFKWVSKLWRALISEPRFIKAHFNRNGSRYRENTIGFAGYQTLCSLEVEGSAVNATELGFLPSRSFATARPCVCNGLVLDFGVNDSAILINPTTREYSTIHPPPAANLLADGPYFRCKRGQANGFGYDSRNDDYKFVKLTDLPQEDQYFRKISIYSLRTNCSREIIVLMNGFYSIKQPTGVYLNGRLHWICVKLSMDGSFWYISAFNLESEEFEVVELPRSLTVWGRPPMRLNSLCALNGRLICISYNQDNNPAHIWMMEYNGATEYSWKNIPICGLIKGRSSARPLICLMNGGQEVGLQVDLHKMVAYKVEEKKARDLKICGVPAGTAFEFCGTYVESLVSPKCVIGPRKDHGGGGGGSEVTTAFIPVDNSCKAGMHKKEKGTEIVAAQAL